MIVDDVEKNSIAHELGFKKGDKILSVNGLKPRDVIEYSYIINDEFIDLTLQRENGEIEEFEIEKDLDCDLGISFTSAVFDKIKVCTNHCIFCFVDGEPEGLRQSLYIKDDDWRLSYIQGTYITLTNLKNEDFERIKTFHISPLFVSLHTTNPDLRAKMLKNPNAKKIVEQLDFFKKNKIELHLQIVLCPEYNDGDELQKTLDDLKKYKSIIKSIAVVPVGISKYHKSKLKRVNKEIALETINMVDLFNAKAKKHLAMASDEFFLLAGRDVPSAKYYGDFLQIENGIGALRLMRDSFNKCLKKMKKKLKKQSKITVATATSASRLFREFAYQIKVEGLEFDVVEVKNKFFGENINVAGLITGSDIIEAIKDKDIEHLVISSVMLKKTGEGYEDRFLDDLTLKDLENSKKGIKIHVHTDCYSFEEMLRLINSL